MKQLHYNGRASGDFGIYISAGSVYNAPQRDVTAISVPGRNGSILLDNGRYLDVSIRYPAFIHQNFATRAADVREWLCSAPARYMRLSDDYDPDHYRLAYYAGGIDFDLRPLNTAAEFDLIFAAKPQRYLISGDTPQEYSASGTITNPTQQPAAPLITVYGSSAGSITVGTTTIQINAIDTSITIDTDTGDAYRGATNCNGDILASKFPTLVHGDNAVAFDGGITSVSITPRWWTI